MAPGCRELTGAMRPEEAPERKGAAGRLEDQTAERAEEVSVRWGKWALKRHR